MLGACIFRVDVLGLGSMGKNHTWVCTELSNVELVGIADKNNEILHKIAKRFDIAAYTDYKELLILVDTGIVSTPTITHYSISMDPLNKEKNILVEKPICGSVEKANN